MIIIITPIFFIFILHSIGFTFKNDYATTFPANPYFHRNRESTASFTVRFIRPREFSIVRSRLFDDRENLKFGSDPSVSSGGTAKEQEGKKSSLPPSQSRVSEHASYLAPAIMVSIPISGYSLRVTKALIPDLCQPFLLSFCCFWMCVYHG